MPKGDLNQTIDFFNASADKKKTTTTTEFVMNSTQAY